MKMFQAISKHDLIAIRLLHHNFIRTNNEAALLLCLDTVFSTPLELGSKTPTEIASCFEEFLNYARTMQRLTCHSDPCNYPPVKKLFTFSAYDEDHCLLHEGSLLLSSIEAQRMERDANGWRGVVILRRDLQRLVKDALRIRLKQRVLEQNENFNNLRSIRPCFLFATSCGHCPRGDLCENYHAPAKSNGAMNYNVFVRIYVLQIMIYHTLYATDIRSGELFKQQRYFLAMIVTPSCSRLDCTQPLAPAFVRSLVSATLHTWFPACDLLRRHPRAAERRPLRHRCLDQGPSQSLTPYGGRTRLPQQPHQGHSPSDAL